MHWGRQSRDMSLIFLRPEVDWGGSAYQRTRSRGAEAASFSWGIFRCVMNRNFSPFLFNTSKYCTSALYCWKTQQFTLFFCVAQRRRADKWEQAAAAYTWNGSGQVCYQALPCYMQHVAYLNRIAQLPQNQPPTQTSSCATLLSLFNSEMRDACL
jgi:hypothetical protein